MPRKWFGWGQIPLVILAAALLLGLTVRIRLLDAPLERDEGEHACAARAMLAGNPPWKLAYNMKPPGADCFYALSMALFGQTAGGIRLGFMLVNTATLLLVVLLGKRLFGLSGGAVAGASWELLSLGQNVVGTIAHSTQLVALCAVAGALLQAGALIRNGAQARPRRLFCAGLCYGLAFLMKQPGIAFAAFGVVFLLCEFVWTRTPIGRCASRILLFGFGVAFPYLLVCLWLWRAGVFPRFWFWTVTLAQAYLIQRPLASWYSFLRRALPGILLPNFVLWILAAFGLALVCCRKAHRRAGLFTALLLLFSILAVSAGGSFNANYFAMMLPAAALAIGGGVASAERVRRWPVICFAAACACSVFVQRDYLFTMTPEEFSRITYGRNPFLEAVKVGDYIRANSRNDARIAVLGSEAEISFYSDRPLATGYLFAYSLMEEHRWAATLQGEMIGEIEASKPEFIVFVDNPLSWIVRAHSSRAIFYWAADYTSRYYEATGFVDMPWQGTVKYYWGPEAAARARPIETPLMYVGPGGREPDYSLTVYRRK